MPTSYVIGVDLGGTKIRAGIFRLSDYKLIKKIVVPTGVKGGKKTVLSNLEGAIKKIIRKNTIFIGVGIAGIVNHEKGIFLSGPNLPSLFKNVSLAKKLETIFKIPTKIENDARCFALAEAKRGAGRGCDRVFGLTLGTGVGGGLFSNGELVRGTIAAGEVGHLPIADELPGHDPSKTIDLENAASGKGLEKSYVALSGESVSSEEIEKRYRKNEKHARDAFKIGRHALVKGLASIQLLFDPDCIVIGGGLGRVEIYWKPAVAKARNLGFPSLKKMKVKRAALGDDAGMLGAALLHLQDSE